MNNVTNLIQASRNSMALSHLNSASGLRIPRWCSVSIVPTKHSDCPSQLEVPLTWGGSGGSSFAGDPRCEQGSLEPRPSCRSVPFERSIDTTSTALAQVQVLARWQPRRRFRRQETPNGEASEQTHGSPPRSATTAAGYEYVPRSGPEGVLPHGSSPPR